VKGLWRRLSKRNKARVVFYPTLVLSLPAFLAFCMVMPGASHVGPLPPATDVEKKLAEELRADVDALAGPGERNDETPGTMPRAEAFITSAFRDAGLVPGALAFDSGKIHVANIEAIVPGGKEIVVVGAHYDTALFAPGADDNASGVAALLALARRFAHAKPKRTLRFVAFANEEPPHFWMPTMGSLVYAKQCKLHLDDIVAMLSLESIGYYSDAPGSQKYPPIVQPFYPDRGDFLAFVGNTSSRGLVRGAIRTFRETSSMPSSGAALPGFVTGVGWSDQWSFWQVGYPGLMITDTAVFRNPNYHTRDDKPDTLDYARLARVVEGVEAIVRELID